MIRLTRLNAYDAIKLNQCVNEHLSLVHCSAFYFIDSKMMTVIIFSFVIFLQDLFHSTIKR